MPDKPDVIPESPSIILRATHILLIRIVQSQASAWQPVSTGIVSRTVSLSLILAETLKGDTQEAAGEPVSLQVTQYDTSTTRITAVKGVWSHKPIEPGTVLMAFCRSDSTMTSELLQDSTCERLDLAEPILDDVRLALEAETDNLRAVDLLRQAAAIAASLDFIFVEYFWARYGNSTIQNSEEFAALMQFMLLPDLSYIARATLLDNIYSRLIASPHLPIERVSQLTSTLFQLINISSAQNLHDNIIQVFLPNLVGLTAGRTEQLATEVFSENPSERQMAKANLQNYQGQASTQPLLEWLQ